MGEDSKIEWTDNTWNPWWGCTRVSAACDFCYAEALSKRFGHDLWGNKPRMRTSAANWHKPIQWNKKAAAAGVRVKVFCASMADVFDNQVPEEWRTDLWALIRATPNLDWQLLTKRPQNIKKMLPADWGMGYRNVWLGMTAENQEEFDKRILSLLAVPAVVHFLSCEPLLGSLDLEYPAGVFPKGPARCCSGHECGCLGLPVDPPLINDIDWVICGGESGSQARPMHPNWARELRDQCQHHGVAFHFKQYGEWRSEEVMPSECAESLEIEGKYIYMLPDGSCRGDGGAHMVKLGKKASGRELDGRTWDEFPKVAA